jgi:DNA repair protein RadA/Sms
MVDTVLYFEGDRGHPYRILRAVKNRFGSTNEIGVFEMKDNGLSEVFSPSELFLAERAQTEPGSVVVPSLEGSRPILIEVQALVSPTSFGMPRRMAMGVDPNRLSLLSAVLERKVGMKLYNQDIFLNVAGGLKITEPAVDLGIISAVASSLLEKPVEPSTVIFGEVGLAGEVRGISQSETRVKEAEKLGFKRCILPRNNEKRFQGNSSLQLLGVSSIEEVLRLLFKKGSRVQFAFGGKGSSERE